MSRSRSGDRFVVKAFDAGITFATDAEGKVSGLVFNFMGREMRLGKVK